MRELKGFHAGEVQDDQPRPEEEGVIQADEPEEQRHVNAVLIAHTLLHEDGIDTIHDRATERHRIAEGDLGVGFMRESTSVLVVIFAGEVDGGDQGNTHKGS